MVSRLQSDVTIHFCYPTLIFTITTRRYDSLLLPDVDFHSYNPKFKFKKMRAKRSVEIPDHITPSLGVTCALLMRSYINRSFFRNTFKAIQLSVLLHILTESHFFFIKEKTTKKKSIIIEFIKNIHVVNNFKTNLSIKMNIFDSKEIIIDFFKENIIFIKYQNVSIFIQFTL